jgi:hypothetical protein
METEPAREPMSVGEAWFRPERLLRDERMSDLAEDDAEIEELDALGARPGWALVLGGIGGGIGGAAMMLASAEVAQRLRIDVDVVRTVGRCAHGLAGDPFEAGMGLAIGIGAVLGVPLGGLLRYSLRLVARVLAAPLLAAVLWTLVHAFLFKSFAPHSLGALPFAPMVVGAAVYGLCVAILRPPRRRRAATDI